MAMWAFQERSVLGGPEEACVIYFNFLVDFLVLLGWRPIWHLYSSQMLGNIYLKKKKNTTAKIM